MASLVTTTTPPPPTHWSRKDELEKIRSTFHPKEILTCNKSLCSLCFASSPFIRATIRFHLRDNYPEKMAIVELDTPLLASGVGKKLLKACEDRVALCASSNDMQVFNTACFLKDMIRDNKLLSCIHEVKKETKKAKQQKICHNVTLSEKTGLIRLDLANTNNALYSVTVDLKIPNRYPSEEPKIIFRRSTFPKEINHVYHAQVCEIVRRCALGYTREQAIRGSNGLKRPPQKKKKGKDFSKARVTTEKLSQLKNDVKVLKQMSALRKDSKMNHKKKNQYKQQRNQKALNDGMDDARRARKELRNLVKDETKKEDQWQEEEARMNAIEEGLLNLNANDIPPTSSVGLAIDFLVNQFVGRIPQEKCQGCDQLLLASNPKDAKGVFSSKSKQRPRRVYCGHFWHTDCLNTCLTLPPFGQNGCPGCMKDAHQGKEQKEGGGSGEVVRVWHHEWSRDIKKHEKAWSNKMAREREIQEVQDIFGFNSDDFDSDEDVDVDDDVDVDEGEDSD